MTYIIQAIVHCDYPNCRHQYLTVGGRLATDYRDEAARKGGWSYTESAGDRCPTHKDTGLGQ